MSVGSDTVDQTGREETVSGPPQPGFVAILAAGAPSRGALAVSASGIEIGRGSLNGRFTADDRISRRHVRICAARGLWGVEDLSSRNGTYVNGEKIVGYAEFSGAALIRIGRSLLWCVDDIGPFSTFHGGAVDGQGVVLGGLLGRAWEEIAVASRAGDTLLIRGESGSGKELAARRMHEAYFGGAASAPFVAVNCAAIPEGLAERLLFGAKKGAYSGAVADAQGYVAAAHRGTLFLDEIAELDPLVQAKLLRVLETREVLPLGEARSRPVQIRVCAATHRDLREEVARGRFRQDLYFRLGRPEVVLPPLRQRLDELPWLIQAELQRSGSALRASAGFVEACALRTWPGNVRELLREVRLASHAALQPGASVTEASALEAEHLSPTAGLAIELRVTPATSTKSVVGLSSDAIGSALAQHRGNVTRAARALGLHRNQLRRWLAKRENGTADAPQKESER